MLMLGSKATQKYWTRIKVFISNKLSNLLNKVVKGLITLRLASLY
jgi:hypothetical protein